MVLQYLETCLISSIDRPFWGTPISDTAQNFLEVLDIPIHLWSHRSAYLLAELADIKQRHACMAGGPLVRRPMYMLRSASLPSLTSVPRPSNCFGEFANDLLKAKAVRQICIANPEKHAGRKEEAVSSRLSRNHHASKGGRGRGLTLWP